MKLIEAYHILPSFTVYEEVWSKMPLSRNIVSKA
jgi:hypothetical protein